VLIINEISTWSSVVMGMNPSYKARPASYCPEGNNSYLKKDLLGKTKKRAVVPAAGRSNEVFAWQRKHNLNYIQVNMIAICT